MLVKRMDKVRLRRLLPLAAPSLMMTSAATTTGEKSRFLWRESRGLVTDQPRRAGIPAVSKGGLRMSISQGPEEPSLITSTLPEHFARIVSRHGDQPAVISRSPTAAANAPSGVSTAPTALETIQTYHSLDLESNSLAHSLRSLGVKKGDRVAVSLGNGPEHVALTFAIFKLGAILVPLNPSFNAKQVTAALTHLEVEVLVFGAVTDLAFKPCNGRSNLPLLEALVPDLKSGKIESPGIPSLKKVIVIDNLASHPLVPFELSSYSSLIPYHQLVDPPSSPSTTHRELTPDSPLRASNCINIQFTSGTTSQPKAAMLSHTSILNNGSVIAHRMGMDSTDKIVCPPPLFHCFGSVLGLLATVSSGAAIMFPSPAFDPVASLRMVADHRATGLYGVPTMLVAMLELLSRSEFSHVVDPAKAAQFPSHLRKGIAAGSSVPEALMLRLYETLGLRDLVICYGMTETAPVSCMTTPTDPFEKKTSSVGHVMPHTRVKVVDPADRQKVLPVGEKGELAASGYLVMQGYWGDEERTREVRIFERDDGTAAVPLGSGELPDAAAAAVSADTTDDDHEESGGRVWMYSGDEAYMDEDGFVHITGRIKDLIIRGGENIHPLEIENCLFQHPLVAEASVVGVPDERLGEAVGAFVIPHGDVTVMEDPAPEGDTPTNGRSSGNSAGPVLWGATSHAQGGKSPEKILSKDALRDWVKEHLSGHLVPKHIFWVDDYPKTGSGKIQKFVLRDKAKKLLADGPR